MMKSDLLLLISILTCLLMGLAICLWYLDCSLIPAARVYASVNAYEWTTMSKTPGKLVGTKLNDASSF